MTDTEKDGTNRIRHEIGRAEAFAEAAQLLHCHALSLAVANDAAGLRAIRNAALELRKLAGLEPIEDEV